MLGRKNNWQMLNKKALKKIHLPLDLNIIDSFVQRKSSTHVQQFLRMLRAKMIAYEPVYATLNFDDGTTKTQIYEKGTKSIPSIRRSITISESRTKPPGGKEAFNSQRVTREASDFKRIAETSTVKPALPAAAQSTKIISKLKGKEELARRASLMTGTTKYLDFLVFLNFV